MLFQADDEGSTPFIRSHLKLAILASFFLFKSLCYKDLGELSEEKMGLSFVLAGWK